MKNVIIILCIIFFGTAETSAQGFLKTQGQIIVDGNGDEVILKGYGLGGWLVPEGYMLQTSGFANSPSEIRAKIVDLIGENGADNFFDAYRANYVAREDIDAIASWGFNSIRMPFHYEIITPRDQPGVYLDEGWAYFDSLLSWCKTNDLYLILDMHCAPGGQNSGSISDYDPAYPSLWESEANRTRTVEIWQTIADRYKNETMIAGYDLINETAWNLPNNNQLLRDLFIDITNAIRDVDTNHILFIEGNWYATDFTGLTPPWDDNMAYSFHKYWSSNDQGSISGWLAMRANSDCPLWLGETGENSNSWFTDCVMLMNNNNVGWNWWTHKKISTTTSPYSSPVTVGYQYLLDYWNGHVPRPTSLYAEGALMSQAENLKLENCIYIPGVIDALTRQAESDVTIPYADNSVPGKIYAAQYDFGRRGSAWSDAEYENVGGTNWNNGWQYRNDGVDIEECSDDTTCGYNVGWIENGDWMKYTINVLYPGTYDVEIRDASQPGGGLMKFIVNGSQQIKTISMPSTGGWQNWQSVILDSVEFGYGTSEIITQSIFGDYNLNYFNFIPVDVNGLPDTAHPTGFMMYQNYPNPFNGVTKIRISSDSKTELTLNIYNLTGEFITNLADHEKIQGTKEYVWEPINNSNISSGVYLVTADARNYSVTKKIIYLK